MSALYLSPWNELNIDDKQKEAATWSTFLSRISSINIR